MLDTEAAWLAGIIEADGYLGLGEYESRTRIKVRVEMIDFDTVQRCWRLTGLGNCGEYKRPGQTWQTTYWWQVQAKREVIAVLQMIEPYLVSERRRNRMLQLLATEATADV